MAFLVPAVAVAGAVLSAVGAVQRGRAEQAAFQSQAQAHELQAQIKEQEAARQAQITAAEEEDFRQQVRRARASQRARTAGAGVDLTGTPALVAEDLAAEAELQALRIRHGGLTEAERLKQEAALERFGAGTATRAGKTARTAGNIRAASLLTSGLANVNFGG